MSQIIVTGAAGVIGRAIVPALRRRGDQLVLLDKVADAGAGVIGVDLSSWEDGWQKHFSGGGKLIHLAGVAQPDADWPQIERHGIDLTLNVIEAAAQAGVRHLVLASSNWVLSGQRFQTFELSSETPPLPQTPYGAAKLMMERVGRLYAEARGLSVTAVRIGYFQHNDDALPGPHMAWGSWGQSMWLSRRDLIGGLLTFIDAEEPGRFALPNLVSANSGSRWSMEGARALGYEPVDGHPIERTDQIEQQEAVAAALWEQRDQLRALLMRTRW